jgi:hypothetical protein
VKLSAWTESSSVKEYAMKRAMCPAPRSLRAPYQRAFLREKVNFDRIAIHFQHQVWCVGWRIYPKLEIQENFLPMFIAGRGRLLYSTGVRVTPLAPAAPWNREECHPFKGSNFFHSTNA